MVRTPYGLGSVTLLAFDLDKAPFTAWQGRGEFWRVLLDRLGPRKRQGEAMNSGYGVEDPATRLQRELDNFDVPVISFGWVAVFILLYILVVGPLDYFLLKKVFKRLEWTWITFPAVVLLVSVIAYFTAYALKGNDLKINKVDLVEIDQRTDPGQAHAYGTCWFTILSPRIQNYTVGVEPALGTWVKGADKMGGDPMVTWLGRADDGSRGFGRQRSQSLFSRTYRYAPDAAGLEGVPIPVWTTKAFTASWAAPLPRLAFTADLHHQAENQDAQLVGTIQSHLPVDLKDVQVFYGTKVYTLDQPLKAGAEPLKVALVPGRGNDPDRREWNAPVQDEFVHSPVAHAYNPTPMVMQMLFREYTSTYSHSFRRLDQSWRLWRQHELQVQDEGVRELILVGRLDRAAGAAEPLTADPRLPTRLWLGDLPGEGKTRPALSGHLVQDTYVRVFLPVQPK
jgi:hypothetical protein